MVQSCLLLRGGQETSQKVPPYLPGGGGWLIRCWHYTIPYTTLHYTQYATTNATATTLTNYNTPHYIQQLWVRWLTTWPLQWLNHSKKHNSNYLSVHQWICSAIRDSQQPTLFLFLKLPPPPCAVLLVYGHVWKWSDYTCICIYIFFRPQAILVIPKKSVLTADISPLNFRQTHSSSR